MTNHDHLVVEIKGDELAIPKAQRRAPAPSLEAIAKRHAERNEAIVAAYATGAFSYREIAERCQLRISEGKSRLGKSRFSTCPTGVPTSLNSMVGPALPARPQALTRGTIGLESLRRQEDRAQGRPAAPDRARDRLLKRERG